MDVVLIKFVFGLIFLFFASLKDFKSREVWDWLSFSFIAFGFLINLFFSIYYRTFAYITSSLVGFGIAYILSLLLFYLGQWGGGDAKIFMALGSLLGVNFSFSLDKQIFYLPGFIISLILTAWIYGLLLVFMIYFRKKDFFDRKFKSYLSKKEKRLAYLAFAFLIFLALALYLIKDLSFFLLNMSFVFLVFVIFCLLRFLRLIETYGFQKKVKIKDLTSGDWVVEKVVIENPNLSFLDYELMIKCDNFRDPSYLLKLFYRIFHPGRDFKKFLVSKFKLKLMKKMKISDEKWLHVKKYSKDLPRPVIEFMKSEGFLIDSNKISVCSPNDLGLLPSQISLLRKVFGENYKLKIKEGIPFIPAFLIAFLFQFILLPLLFEAFFLVV